MAIAGRVAIVPKGDWSADATYKRLDAVTYNNTLYFAKKDVPAGTATSNTEYWSKSIVGGASAIATTEDAGVVKPDGKSMSVDESGTLSINLDGTTITLDEAKNVIKLADTLKDKINGAFPAANLINNLTTTEAGFGLDARQGKALDDKITEINGSLNNIKKGGWLEHGKAISFNIYDNTSYFLFLNSAGNVYASVLSTVYDFHNTIIKNDFNDNDIEISYDHNTRNVTVKNNSSLIIDFRCI
jgi:hypothetical protein